MKKGFTLLEIVVVTGIIMVLTSIVIIQVQKFKESSEAASRNEFVRQTVTALGMHYSRYGGYPKGTLEEPHCVGYISGETCTHGATTYSGDTTFHTALKDFFPGIYKLTNPMWGASQVAGETSASSKKHQGIVYRPGSSADPLPCEGSLCQGYELTWYIPGQKRDCSPGFIQSCGTQPNIDKPYNLTYCQLNVPRRSTDDSATC